MWRVCDNNGRAFRWATRKPKIATLKMHCESYGLERSIWALCHCSLLFLHLVKSPHFHFLTFAAFIHGAKSSTNQKARFRRTTLLHQFFRPIQKLLQDNRQIGLSFYGWRSKYNTTRGSDAAELIYCPCVHTLLPWCDATTPCAASRISFPINDYTTKGK